MTKRHLIKTSFLAGLGVIIPCSAKAEQINLKDWEYFHIGSCKIPIDYLKKDRRDVFILALKRCLTDRSNPFHWSLSKKSGQTRVIGFEEVKVLWKFDSHISDFCWGGDYLIVKAKMRQADYLLLKTDSNEIFFLANEESNNDGSRRFDNLGKVGPFARNTLI